MNINYMYGLFIILLLAIIVILSLSLKYIRPDKSPVYHYLLIFIASVLLVLCIFLTIYGDNLPIFKLFLGFIIFFICVWLISFYWIQNTKWDEMSIIEKFHFAGIPILILIPSIYIIYKYANLKKIESKSFGSKSKKCGCGG
jgi:hypothetical protein